MNTKRQGQGERKAPKGPAKKATKKPFVKPKGEIPKSTRTRTEAQNVLLRKVRHYHARQTMRKSVGNQIGAIVRQEFLTEEEGKVLTDQHVVPMEKGERQIIKDAQKHLPGMPIWDTWLSKIPGIGPNLAVQLVAHIQPVSDFANVAKLWAYFGYHVIDGVAARRQAGKKAAWNHAAKVVCWQAGECFMKQSKSKAAIEELHQAGEIDEATRDTRLARVGPYREFYDLYHASDRNKHPEKITVQDAKTGKAKLDRFDKPLTKYSDGHMMARAQRYTVKMFLSHLWQVWRELEGLPVPGPYAIEFLQGHTHLISPWSMIPETKEQAIAVGL